MPSNEHMLTTIDNPYDPFTEYDDWYNYDTQAQHYTPAFLARIAHSSDDLSEEDQSLALEQTIDEIVRENVSGIYRKITKSDGKPDTSGVPSIVKAL
jgi:hypothetical protein